MALNVVTIEDLQVFKLELIGEIKNILSSSAMPQKQLLKSKDVRQMLGISHGTLQTLRINGTLPYTKVGGTLYYGYEDVMKAVNQNKIETKSKREMQYGD